MNHHQPQHILQLKRGKDDSLLRFHPWVFSGAIASMSEGLESGDIVRVLTADGRYIATGHYQPGTITVRVLSFDDETIDAAFYERRLATALAVRQSIGVADCPTNDTYRLVHGEGDLLPGLIIDCYGPTAVMQAHSVGMHRARHTIAEALIRVMDGRISSVYYKSETTLPLRAELGQENEFIIGQAQGDIATEQGLRFHVDWLRGQKTGFFVDQRDNRALVERYAHGPCAAL